MDKIIYTAMGGASHTLEQQANASNNLANASTTGFKAQLNTFRAVPLVGEGMATRTYVVDSTAGTDFTGGAMQQTGRSLDIAINGDGWLAVQAADGTESYTRAGDLKINENGLLQTQSGHNVLGDTGPITIQPQTNITIASDGTVSSISLNGTPNAVETVGPENGQPACQFPGARRRRPVPSSRWNRCRRRCQRASDAGHAGGQQRQSDRVDGQHD
jgi:flagellar basal-body rod protein FlgF